MRFIISTSGIWSRSDLWAECGGISTLRLCGMKLSASLPRHPTVSVPVVGAAGEQVVDAGGNLVGDGERSGNRLGPTHAAQKAQRIKQWMSREGLEGERKWMSDTVGVAGECLLSPFCQDTQHGRELRERVTAGDAGAVLVRRHLRSSRRCCRRRL
jgi:hypothetical protein